MRDALDLAQPHGGDGAWIEMGDRIACPARERSAQRVIADRAHEPVSDGLRSGIGNKDTFRAALQDFTGGAGRVGRHHTQARGERLDDRVGIALVAALIRCVG